MLQSARSAVHQLFNHVKFTLSERADRFGVSARYEAAILREWSELLDRKTDRYSTHGEPIPSTFLAALTRMTRASPRSVVEVFRRMPSGSLSCFFAGETGSTAGGDPPAFALLGAMRRHPSEKQALYELVSRQRVDDLSLHARAGLIQALHREGRRMHRGRRDHAALDACARVILATTGTDLTNLKRALMLQRGRNDLVRLVFNDI